MNATRGNPTHGFAFATPVTKPASPLFSTGPTRKRPGWTPDALDTASLGRSHRASHPKSRIQDCIAPLGTDHGYIRHVFILCSAP